MENNAIPASDKLNGAAGKNEVQFVTEGRTVYALTQSTGEKIYLGKKYKKGISRIGTQEPAKFITENGEMLKKLNLSDSEINVILSTAENEGNLDAVNTWDNRFLSFGMFQWTTGAAGKAGELAALLQIVKNKYPDCFARYLGRFGLDMTETNGQTGWLSLNGKTLVRAEEKNVLREPVWVWHFACAGADNRFKAVEIVHAVNRLDRFYFTRLKRFGNHAISALITSEYGVALLLDQHVNRPGYVNGCVEEALKQSGLTAEAQTGSNGESILLKNYLKVRETYGRNPMTDAAQRAELTRSYVTTGKISGKRGSFFSHRTERM